MIRRLLFALLVTLAAPAVGQTTPLPNGVGVSNGSEGIVVTALTDSVLRVRVSHGLGFGENASWAVPAGRAAAKRRGAAAARWFPDSRRRGACRSQDFAAGG